MLKHGLRNTQFYNHYRAMKQRCLYKSTSNFKYYGGRGIKVCDRWLESFENFRDDMYESYLVESAKYGKISLDRIDVNGNNCRWITQVKQNLNTRMSANTVDIKTHQYFRHKLQSVLNRIVKRNLHYSCFLQYIGCTVDEFKTYIESKFLSGMTWKNNGQGTGKWQFDHIIGLNNFDLSKEKDRYVAFNYKNVQPMWWIDHKQKSKQKIKGF